MKKKKLIYLVTSALIVLIGAVTVAIVNKNEYVSGNFSYKAAVSDWNEMISNQVNSKGISISVDGSIKVSGDTSVAYMNRSKTVMISVDSLSDLLNCAVNVYDDNIVLVEKGSNVVEFDILNDIYSINDTEYNHVTSPEVVDGRIYVPISLIISPLSYDYSFDIDDAMITLVNTGESSDLPYKYDYRERGKMPVVLDQGRYGTCWAAAAISAINSSLLPGTKIDFSLDHIIYNNGYNVDMLSGGEYGMAIAYMASWTGPVLEESDSYGDGKTNTEAEAVVHLQEAQILPSKDYTKIKEMVFKYGGVTTSIYSDIGVYGTSTSSYNSETYAYCYIGTQKPNHDVVIIGWDDTYSKENFVTEPEGDGAFICINSWGTDFGDSGVFYISYYDVNVGVHNVAYTRIDDSDNYDNIYQSDICGMVGCLGYGSETAYAANVYTVENDEELVAVSFYTTGVDTSYSIYVVTDYEDESSLNRRQYLTGGTISNEGYYTVDLPEGIELTAGSEYAVIIKLTTPNSEHPVAVEYENSSLTSTVTLDDGCGFVSWDGIEWEDTEEKHCCNVCLKAFTNDRNGE